MPTAEMLQQSPAEDDVESWLQCLDCVCQGDGDGSKADVGCNVADGVHEGGAKDLAKLILGDGLRVAQQKGSKEKKKYSKQPVLIS